MNDSTATVFKFSLVHKIVAFLHFKNLFMYCDKKCSELAVIHQALASSAPPPPHPQQKKRTLYAPIHHLQKQVAQSTLAAKKKED